RLPLLSTLFPYTTLFRSLALVAGGLLGHTPLGLDRLGGDVGPAEEGRRVGGDVHRDVLGHLRAGLVATDQDTHLGRQVLVHLVQDRKSTRLNSSHVKTSY